MEKYELHLFVLVSSLLLTLALFVWAFAYGPGRVAVALMYVGVILTGTILVMTRFGGSKKGGNNGPTN